jgi:hypothetical protein
MLFQGSVLLCSNFIAPPKSTLLRLVLDGQNIDERAKWRAIMQRELPQTVIGRFTILDAERHTPCLRGLVTIPGNGSPSPVSMNDKGQMPRACPEGIQRQCALLFSKSMPIWNNALLG